MTDSKQTAGATLAGLTWVKVLDTDWTYVMRLIKAAQQSIEEDQERDLEPFTRSALAYVEEQVYDSAKALHAVIEFQREYCAQQKEAD